MEFTIDAKKMSTALSFVGRVVNAKSIIPVLACVHVSVSPEDGRVTLKATNMEQFLEYAVEADEVAEGGAFVVPHAALHGIVKDIAGPVVFKKGDGDMLSISYGIAGSLKLKCADEEEYPKEAWNGAGGGSEIPVSEELLTALASVSYAASKKEEASTYTFQAVALDCSSGSISAAATDARRLAAYEEAGKADFNGTVLIPADAVPEIIKLAPETMAVSDSMIVFKAENGTFATRLIDGRFPPYREVLPKEIKAAVKIKKPELEPVLRRASSLSSTIQTPVLRVGVKRDSLVFSIKSEDGEFCETVKLDGVQKGPEPEEEITVALNPFFLRDMVSNIPEDEVEISITGPENPVVGRAGRYTALILPLRVNK